MPVRPSCTGRVLRLGVQIQRTADRRADRRPIGAGSWPGRQQERPESGGGVDRGHAPLIDRGGSGISQPLYKALYRLRTAYRHGPREQEKVLACLASMNPDRAKILDTGD